MDLDYPFIVRSAGVGLADWTDNDYVIAGGRARHGHGGMRLYLFYVAGDTTPVVLPHLPSRQFMVDAVTAAG